MFRILKDGEQLYEMEQFNQVPMGEIYFPKGETNDSPVMNWFHTIWTNPYLVENCRWGIRYQIVLMPILCGYSLALLKHFNQTVDLYCDELAAHYLRKFPYDNINVMDLNATGTDPRFWAEKKMAIMNIVPIEDVHLDIDFFIQDVELIKQVYANKDKLCISVREPRNQQLQPFMADLLERDPSPLLREVVESYGTIDPINAGLLNWPDKKLRDTFIKGYYKFKQELSTIQYTTAIPNTPTTAPDLIAEQLWMTYLVDQMEVEEFNLTPNFNYDVSGLLFSHPVGTFKFMVVVEILRGLKELNEEIYNFALEAIEEMGFQIETE